MCNQAVSLIAAAIEERGIPTTCIILLRDIAEQVRPPRALCVPFDLGYPLGKPHDAELQRSVITAALALLGKKEDAPILEDWNLPVS